jgi:endonuclease/exonuclease/phosphatase family metal-dependent hydrolase
MLRILTYNVHRCLGIDGVLSPERIAEVVAGAQPDIVLLQELDVRRKRSGRIDQATEIAARLGMRLHFHPAMTAMEEEYGDAILTPHPSRLVKAGALPGIEGRKLEPRGALWAAIRVGGVELNVVCTHLGLRGRERLAQAECLMGPEWLGSPLRRGPVVLGGDFNAVPSSRTYARFAGTLRDAARAAAGQRPSATYPTALPMLRLDHLFVGEGVEAERAAVLRTPLSRVASDHLPLMADLRIAPAPRKPAAAGAERHRAAQGSQAGHRR